LAGRDIVGNGLGREDRYKEREGVALMVERRGELRLHLRSTVAGEGEEKEGVRVGTAGGGQDVKDRLALNA